MTVYKKRIFYKNGKITNEKKSMRILIAFFNAEGCHVDIKYETQTFQHKTFFSQYKNWQNEASDFFHNFDFNSRLKGQTVSKNQSSIFPSYQNNSSTSVNTSLQFSMQK